MMADDTWVYSVDFPESAFQSRSKHGRHVKLRASGGGTCSCEQPPQTGIYCVHIYIAEDMYANQPPGGTGTLATAASRSRRAPSQHEVASMLQGILREYIHPCWQTSTWRDSVKDLCMHAVELQSLQMEHLLPPAEVMEASRKHGPARRKRLPSAGERSSSRTTATALSFDVQMLSEGSSCPNVDEDTCWDSDHDNDRTASGTRCIPRTLTSRSLGGVAPFVPRDYEICTSAPFDNDDPSPQELSALIRAKSLLMHAFDGQHGYVATGWYIGKIKNTINEASMSQKDRPSQGPMPNCVMTYSTKQKQHTKCEGKLVGNVATGLYGHNYGPDQWWVLLKKRSTGAA